MGQKIRVGGKRPVVEAVEPVNVVAALPVEAGAVSPAGGAALMLMIPALALVAGIIAYGSKHNGGAALLAFSLVLAFPGLLLWWGASHLAARVVIDETGVHRLTPYAFDTHARWDQVRRITLEPGWHDRITIHKLVRAFDLSEWQPNFDQAAAVLESLAGQYGYVWGGTDVIVEDEVVAFDEY